MWIISFIFLVIIIYLAIKYICDSISFEVKKANRKKCHGEEELFYITTYKNKKVSNDDIMHSFISQIKKYKKHYFNIEYKLFIYKKEQNYAWSIKTTKQVFGWGIVYNIRFHFSNGWVYLSFSSSNFSSYGQLSREYYIYGIDFGSAEIDKVLGICMEESRIRWKINGMKPKEDLPFNYISLSDNNRASSNNDKTKQQEENESSHENTVQLDLLSFYRNLLGLKLHFSQEELKKSYREAVGKYHPDRYGFSSPRDRENAEILMKQVNEAYEKLKNVAQ
jgi:hypothetical protein